ncbi:lytic polysaccharide monooxygenase, partial [Aaosphaeria arxii CBS 175.79]
HLIQPHSPRTDVFSRLIVNNTLSTDFQYIRDILGVSGTTLWSKSYPIYSPSDPDLICGRSTFPLRNPGIQTAVIRAGDDVSFMLSTPEIKGEPQGYIFHNGPGQVFLSRLPDGVRELGEYDGAGDWFKIAYQG